MTDVGKYLKQARKREGMLLRDVEFVIGMSNAYISQIENGKRYPSFKTIALLSVAYELDYHDIINLYELCLGDLQNDKKNSKMA